MNAVTNLHLYAAIKHASALSFFHWTREILQSYAALSQSSRGKMAGWASQLGEYVHSKRDPAQWRPSQRHEYRVAWLRNNPADDELVPLACLWPGTVDGTAKKRNRDKPMSEDELERATEWLCDATECLETFRILPAAVRREWLEHCRTDQPLPSDATPLTTLAVLAKFEAENNVDEIETYRKLSTAKGQQLARAAVESLGSNTYAGREIAAHILFRLACLVPDALDGCHDQLAEHQMFRSGRGVVYRGAGPTTSKQLLKLENSVEDPDGWLKALAWIGDRNVVSQFHHWQRQPSKKWKSRIFVKPEAYCYEAGWELASGGKRCTLCFETCYQLISSEHSGKQKKREPVTIGIPRTDLCGRCKNPLTDLYDLDLTDPRLAFLGLRGTRIRIVTCSSCMACDYCNFDTKGNTSWSPKSKPSEMPPEEYQPFAERSHVLGAPARTPAEPLMGGSRLNASSWFGGYPNLINDAEYPPCPKCKRSMMYLSCLDLGGVSSFTFICRECCIAATTYDCT